MSSTARPAGTYSSTTRGGFSCSRNEAKFATSTRPASLSSSDATSRKEPTTRNPFSSAWRASPPPILPRPITPNSPPFLMLTAIWILISGAGDGFSSHTDLVEMKKEIPRVLIDAIGSRALEFFPAVPAREEADAKCAGAARSQKIPHAIPDHDSVGNVHSKLFARGDEEGRIRLRMLDLISRDHRRTRRVDSYSVSAGPGARHSPTRRHRPRHLVRSQMFQQLFGAW